jgi:hypothetical protein
MRLAFALYLSAIIASAVYFVGCTETPKNAGDGITAGLTGVSGVRTDLQRTTKSTKDAASEAQKQPTVAKATPFLYRIIGYMTEQEGMDARLAKAEADLKAAKLEAERLAQENAKLRSDEAKALKARLYKHVGVCIVLVMVAVGLGVYGMKKSAAVLGSAAVAGLLLSIAVAQSLQAIEYATYGVLGIGLITLAVLVYRHLKDKQSRERVAANLADRVQRLKAVLPDEVRSKFFGGSFPFEQGGLFNMAGDPETNQFVKSVKPALPAVAGVKA